MWTAVPDADLSEVTAMVILFALLSGWIIISPFSYSKISGIFAVGPGSVKPRRSTVEVDLFAPMLNQWIRADSDSPKSSWLLSFKPKYAI